MFAGPPPGRFCGEWASEIQRNSARPTEIHRNRLLLGMEGRNFAPQDSAVGFVEISSGNPSKRRRFADPPPGRLFGQVARFRGIPPDRPEFSEIATYLGRMGGIPRLSILWQIVKKYLQEIMKIPVVREPAIQPVLLRRGEILRNSAQPGEIQ